MEMAQVTASPVTTPVSAVSNPVTTPVPAASNPVAMQSVLTSCPICGHPTNGKNFCSRCGFRLK